MNNQNFSWFEITLLLHIVTCTKLLYNPSIKQILLYKLKIFKIFQDRKKFGVTWGIIEEGDGWD
jgi:hypothetical protein